jgi:hypothetical protein
MTAPSTLTRTDWDQYLFRLYFGSEPDPLLACIKRAYLDFSRTLHGLGRLSAAEELHDRAAVVVKESVRDLKGLSRTHLNGDEFDRWHKAACQRLVSLYSEYGHHLFVGQAQKWLNMTMKYVFTFGEERLPGFGETYAYCHVPLDNIILIRLDQYDFPALSCAWSRLDNYSEYLDRQTWIRVEFPIPPLDVEFLLWLGKEVEPKKE